MTPRNVVKDFIKESMLKRRKEKKAMKAQKGQTA
jgi:hypothetical protein